MKLRCRAGKESGRVTKSRKQSGIQVRGPRSTPGYHTTERIRCPSDKGRLQIKQAAETEGQNAENGVGH